MTQEETNQEQSVEQRDREWLDTVYKGDTEPQLTVRAVVAGMLFGGLMSLSNLYIGLKSGWGLGVDIAAVIVIYAVFKGLAGAKIVRRPFGMMENTITMTVAVAASWISSAGLVSAVPALTMLTGYTFVWWQLTLLIGFILYLGLFMAIPLKRQMISIDSLRFPANIPTGETLKAVYAKATGAADEEAKEPAQGFALWISPIAAAVALVCFFLPWVTFEKNGAVVSLSGMQLGGISWALFAAAVVALGAIFVHRSRGRLDAARPIVALVSAFGMAWALFEYFRSRSGIWVASAMVQPQEAGAAVGWGGVLVFLGFFVALLGSVFLRTKKLGGSMASKKARSLGLAGAAGVVVAGLRDGLGWIPGQFNLPFSIVGTTMSKLTLSLEPSLIFISIGALFGMKVGMSMLFGLVLNYGVLAPNLMEAKIIKHAAPIVRAVSEPVFPLSVPAGQSLTLLLEEADKGPMIATGSAVKTLSYTWPQAAEYQSLPELVSALGAERLSNGEPNPLYGVVKASDVEATLSKEQPGGKATPYKGHVLALEASKSIYWESKLSIAKEQPAELVKALGLKPEASQTPTLGGFRNISAWSLWPGATVLVVGGLLALAFQWRTLGKTFGSIFSGLSGGNANAKKGLLEDIEIPMAWFLPGVAVFGLLAAGLLMFMFKIHWYMGLIAVLLTFFLAAVAARAGAEIGINPIGALGKVTQLTFGAIAPGNIMANLMTAGVTAGASASCSDTVGNLKVGHMVGANPRKQFIGQLFGVLAGSLLAVPAYFILVPDATTLGGEKFPAPSALVWMGVAKVLSQGFSTLPRGALLAMGIAFVIGVAIVILDKVFPKIKPYTPSPAALGIALTIPAYTSFSMFLGALVFFILEKRAPKWNDTYTIAIASGCIAGESIMGVVLAGLTAAGVVG
ncbi:MAG: OPT/YSL family transporter [bacterium]